MITIECAALPPMLCAVLRWTEPIRCRELGNADFVSDMRVRPEAVSYGGQGRMAVFLSPFRTNSRWMDGLSTKIAIVSAQGVTRYALSSPYGKSQRYTLG